MYLSRVIYVGLKSRLRCTTPDDGRDENNLSRREKGEARGGPITIPPRSVLAMTKGRD